MKAAGKAQRRPQVAPIAETTEVKRGNIQRWQELGGLTGRIVFAILLLYVASRVLIRIFLLPGVVLFPVTYLVLYQGDFAVFCIAVFFCGLVTVAQFSYVSEYLPKVFPVHLRGTGSAFATNIGGRMLGTMAAVVNTELLSPMFFAGEGDEKNPHQVATAAAIIGGAVYAIAAGAVLPATDATRGSPGRAAARSARHAASTIAGAARFTHRARFASMTEWA